MIAHKRNQKCYCTYFFATSFRLCDCGFNNRVHANFYTKPPWRLEYFDIEAFESFLDSLNAGAAAIVYQKVTQVLAIYGTDLINRGLVKPLGARLYEYRIRENPDVLVRVFFELAPGRTILILHFYDKKAKSSSNFQQSQIKIARKRQTSKP